MALDPLAAHQPVQAVVEVCIGEAAYRDRREIDTPAQDFRAVDFQRDMACAVDHVVDVVGQVRLQEEIHRHLPGFPAIQDLARETEALDLGEPQNPNNLTYNPYSENRPNLVSKMNDKNEEKRSLIFQATHDNHEVLHNIIERLS